MKKKAPPKKTVKKSPSKKAAPKKKALTFKTFYPWSKWTDGKPHKITQGKDFTVSITNMQSAIYGFCRRRGYGVTVHQVDPKTLELKVTI